MCLSPTAKPTRLIKQVGATVEITRSLSEQLAVGNIFYSLKALNENRPGISDSFKASIYPATGFEKPGFLKKPGFLLWEKQSG